MLLANPRPSVGRKSSKRKKKEKKIDDSAGSPVKRDGREDERPGASRGLRPRDWSVGEEDARANLSVPACSWATRAGLGDLEVTQLDPWGTPHFT